MHSIDSNGQNIEILGDALSAFKVECEQTEGERQRVQQSMDALRAKEGEDGQREFGRLRAECGGFEEEMEAIKLRKNRVHKELRDRDGQIAAAQKKRDGLVLYVQRIRQKIDDSKAEHQRKLSELDHFEADTMRKIERLRREHDEEKEPLYRELEEVCNGHINAINHLKKQCADEKAAYQRLKVELRTLKRKSM